jgi:NlpC/P60 family putative phage cell wall peptidase
MITTAQRIKVVSVAKSWLGTPYHSNAAIKGVGVDCARLLVEIYAEAGLIEHFVPDPYPADWHLHRSDEQFTTMIERYADEINKPNIGDVIVMRFGRCFSHGAVCVADNEIIHAYINRPVEMSALSDFSDRVKKYYRVRNGR